MVEQQLNEHVKEGAADIAGTLFILLNGTGHAQ